MSEIGVEVLANYGVLGVVLIWFMFRTENIIKENTKAITEMAKLLEKICTQLNHSGGIPA